MKNINITDCIVTQTLKSGKGALTQKKIIEATIMLFAEKGYSNTSTNEIAKEAGIAEGTLFRYYKTKEALLDALVEPFLLEVLPKISDDMLLLIQLHNFEHFEEFLKFLINDRIGFIQENQQTFKIFIKEVLYRDSFREKWRPKLNPRLFSFFNQFMDACKARGEIKPLPNVVIFRMLATFIVGYFVSRFIFLPENMLMDDDKEIDTLLSLIMSGVGSNP